MSRATTIGSSNAPLEREADRAATAVLNAQQPGLGQASDAGASSQPIDPDTRAQLQQLSGAGRPLSIFERSLFEPAFGVDLRHVRIHQSSLASEVAESIDAQAFNIGLDIVLGAAAPSVGTRAGRELLAHELAHVVQRATGPSP
ncbi:MAG TPA: DUF4157 domain-containing protein, partial [Enhygromyxa sp.]|nr:DUF4157 domain-containing protein [Enhygromyxa sp.]